MNPLLRSGLFGRLFADSEIADMFSAEAMLDHMLAFEAAWTRALRNAGLVTPNQAKLALRVIESLDVEVSDLSNSVDRDGMPVAALVSELRDRAGPEGEQAIHHGATSQDVIDTAMVLALREVLIILEQRLSRCVRDLDALNERFGEASIMGRTRMQAARPIRVADRIRAWRAGFSRALEDMALLQPRLLRVQYGGAVGTRDGTDGRGAEIAEALTHELELSPGDDCWHTDRTSIADMGHWLTRCAGACGKLGWDIALMAQQGVGEAVLHEGGESSAMPHKNNPVRAEGTVALARFVATQQSLLGNALIHEQERSGSAWALEWLVLPIMAEATGAALRETVALLSQIERLGA